MVDENLLKSSTTIRIDYLLDQIVLTGDERIRNGRQVGGDWLLQSYEQGVTV